MTTLNKELIEYWKDLTGQVFYEMLCEPQDTSAALLQTSIDIICLYTGLSVILGDYITVLKETKEKEHSSSYFFAKMLDAVESMNDNLNTDAQDLALTLYSYMKEAKDE